MRKHLWHSGKRNLLSCMRMPWITKANRHQSETAKQIPETQKSHHQQCQWWLMVRDLSRMTFPCSLWYVVFRCIAHSVFIRFVDYSLYHTTDGDILQYWQNKKWAASVSDYRCCPLKICFDPLPFRWCCHWWWPTSPPPFPMSAIWMITEIR